MNVNIIFVIMLVLLILLFLMVITLFFRVRKLEVKSLDISARDVAMFATQMREILVESECIAERLDSAIRERESALEDLGDLVDARIARLKDFSGQEIEFSEPGGDLHAQVYRLLSQGRTQQEIARLLNVSVAEVGLIAALR